MPTRQWFLLGFESLFEAGSALRLIRPTSNSQLPSLNEIYSSDLRVRRLMTSHSSPLDSSVPFSVSR